MYISSISKCQRVVLRVKGKLVKIFSKNKKFLAKGHILSMNSETIRVKGINLPLIESKSPIIIEMYDDFLGVSTCHCQVSVASEKQLNAFIKSKSPPVERRTSLKVPTDLSFYIESLIRNGEDCTEDFPNTRIDILNLSIGGMLISANYDLYVNDIINFHFYYERNLVILLKAKVIRIDKSYDLHTKELSKKSYGCMFEQLPPSQEAVITKYLYKRQLEIYKDKQE